MSTRIKPVESHVKLADPELPAGIRSGGENQPLAYPHLYQIQAGDWRISYAVEHNRLAILVLEVLGQDGESSKDAVQEKLTRKMKIKLLDWPEGSGSGQVPPEVLTKKMKIKWMDLADEGEGGPIVDAHSKSRIKLKGASPARTQTQQPAGAHKITLLGAGEAPAEDPPEVEEQEGDPGEEADPRITPLDKPSM